MYIQKIKWINRSILEAELVVTDGKYSVLCFAYPCEYSVGDPVRDFLECLSVTEIQTSNTKTPQIIHKDGGFQYTICGCLTDASKGIIQVGKLVLHIQANRIPKDISNGQFIQFSVQRIDLY